MIVYFVIYINCPAIHTFLNNKFWIMLEKLELSALICMNIVERLWDNDKIILSQNT